MKSCPTCNRTFEDSFTFCLVDGAILSAPYDPQATLRIPEARVTNPQPTEVIPQRERPTPAELPSTIQSPLLSTIAASPAPQPIVPRSVEKSSNQRNLNRLIYKGAIMGMGTAAIMIVIVSVLMAFGREGIGEGLGLFAAFFVAATVVGAVIHPLIETIRNRKN